MYAAYDIKTLRWNIYIERKSGIAEIVEIGFKTEKEAIQRIIELEKASY